MNGKIKEKAQELYPISENAECYTAFLQGARYVFAVIWGDSICDYFNQWVGIKLVPIEAKEEFIEKARKMGCSEKEIKKIIRFVEKAKKNGLNIPYELDLIELPKDIK